MAAPLAAAEPVRSMAAARTPENMASVDASAMEGKVQSLPERLRTRHPGAWTEEDVSDWVKGWGASFASAAETVKDNGVDGDTIGQTLKEVSQGENDGKSVLQGDQFRVHLCVCVRSCVCVCVRVHAP